MFKCKYDGKKFATAAALHQHSLALHGPQRPNKGRNAPRERVLAPVIRNPVVRNAAEPGSSRISRDEMLFSVTDEGVQKAVALHPDNFPWLKTIAAAYERIKWHSCHIYWKPAVGTHTSGLVIYGVDWNSNLTSSTATETKVQSLTPVLDHPVWQDSRTTPLVLPRSRLMTRKEYLLNNTSAADKQPGQLAIYMAAIANPATKLVVGQVWVRYSVEFFGTQ